MLSAAGICPSDVVLAQLLEVASRRDGGEGSLSSAKEVLLWQKWGGEAG